MLQRKVPGMKRFRFSTTESEKVLLNYLRSRTYRLRMEYSRAHAALQPIHRGCRRLALRSNWEEDGTLCPRVLAVAYATISKARGKWEVRKDG